MLKGRSSFEELNLQGWTVACIASASISRLRCEGEEGEEEGEGGEEEFEGEGGGDGSFFSDGEEGGITFRNNV